MDIDWLSLEGFIDILQAITLLMVGSILLGVVRFVGIVRGEAKDVRLTEHVLAQLSNDERERVLINLQEINNV